MTESEFVEGLRHKAENIVSPLIVKVGAPLLYQVTVNNDLQFGVKVATSLRETGIVARL